MADENISYTEKKDIVSDAHIHVIDDFQTFLKSLKNAIYTFDKMTNEEPESLRKYMSIRADIENSFSRYFEAYVHCRKNL